MAQFGIIFQNTIRFEDSGIQELCKKVSQNLFDLVILPK